MNDIEWIKGFGLVLNALDNRGAWHSDDRLMRLVGCVCESWLTRQMPEVM
jgi:hypothetical protein